MSEDKDRAISSTRRRVLRLFGLGAAGTALGVVAASENLFAKQFAGDVAPTKLPDMIYDPELQLMVDPTTKQPIYLDSQKLATLSATITSSCPTCPKCDDACG
ncbi:MAG: hypothetical protein HY244_16630 [Rhizobiales bacterium]|nr:hypothetical protein [Hyphomicrobiales bacterium]